MVLTRQRVIRHENITALFIRVEHRTVSRCDILDDALDTTWQAQGHGCDRIGVSGTGAGPLS